MEFEWDDAKDRQNVEKHNVSFYEAQEAFFDERRLILEDMSHSSTEKRYFCIGKTTNDGIITVRFTKRSGHIRIIGAGYWRKGKKLYDKR